MAFKLFCLLSFLLVGLITAGVLSRPEARATSVTHWVFDPAQGRTVLVR